MVNQPQNIMLPAPPLPTTIFAEQFPYMGL